MKTSVAFLLLAALIALASAQPHNDNFFKEKSGRCPRKPYNCDEPRGRPCRRDSDCRGDRKCCDVCGQTCTDPETERPDKEEKSGRCPRKPDNCGYKPSGPPCRRDSDCRGSLKCCDKCDRLICTDPETERPDKEEKSGRCPRKSYNCDKPRGRPCRRDSDCRGSRKCCDVCGQTCTEPETERPDKEEHPGKCPREPDRCQPGPKPRPKCYSDDDCGMKQKCCESCGVVKCVDISGYH